MLIIAILLGLYLRLRLQRRKYGVVTNITNEARELEAAEKGGKGQYELEARERRHELEGDKGARNEVGVT